VDQTHKQVFERYLYAGAITRDPEAVAALFTEDGVYETPLGHASLAGRDAIRAGIGAYQRDPGKADLERSGYVLHETADPDVFIVEIDAVLIGTDGQRTTMSLVQIFRLRDGLIARLRDYF
jgi:uncharacterized protein (TIGR02246 family)